MSFSAKSLKRIAEKSNLTKLNSIVSETNSYVKGGREPTDEYKTAVSEMLEIIEYMNKPSVKKLSQKILDFFEENCDSSYVQRIDEKIELEENQLSPKTKSLVTMIYRNYLCSLKERDLLDEILREHNNYIFVQDGEQQFEDLPQEELEHSDCSNEESCEVEEEDIERNEYGLSGCEEDDEELEEDKKFNSYINVKDFDLEEQLVKLKSVRKKIDKNRRKYDFN